MFVCTYVSLRNLVMILLFQEAYRENEKNKKPFPRNMNLQQVSMPAEVVEVHMLRVLQVFK